MSAHQNISVGIDIGSTKVITCVGKVDNNTIDILGFGKSANQGIRKGVIIDLEETVSAISASLEEAERTAGISIQSAVIGISGPYIESGRDKGVIAVSRTDGEISDQDVARVLEAVKVISNKPNRQLIHAIPLNFVIDGSEVIKDPVGMSGIRLEVNSNMISASVNAVRSVQRVVEQSGLNMNDLVFSPLATAKVLLSKRQTDIGAILIDIGASTTSYAVYEEGELITCGVIPIGSMHITNDIAIGLRTNIDIADILKTRYGFAQPDKIDEKETIDLNKIDKTEEGTVNLKYVAEIIEARLNEIFLMIRDNLAAIEKDGTLPSGIILTGGGSKIHGIVELAKETMRLPAQLGRPIFEGSGLIDKLNDPVYATSIGLMLWGKDQTNEGGGSFNFDVQGLNSVVTKVRSIFKNFLP